MDPIALEALQRPEAYPHPAGNVRCIETHISWVYLAGDFAYKIKKPVDLGFLDYSTSARRAACCHEEVRLNRRLAPEWYLGVVGVHGPSACAHVEGTGPIIDHAVKMRAFPAEATLDREAAITPEQIDAIADRIAAFHAEAQPTPAGSPFGTPDTVLEPLRSTLTMLSRLGLDDDAQASVQALSAWGIAEADRLAAHFRARHTDGFIRDCHGDLHLGNIAWVEGAPVIFDCIEFDAGLRSIDVVSECAFLTMDLMARGQAPLAWRYLNRYLMWTGDYTGLMALRFYLVYRALVRAKVDLLRAGQDHPAARSEAMRYIDLASRLSRRSAPRLWLLHGVSGSGKSRLAGELAEAHGAIWLRSDVERKRLHGLGPFERSTAVAGGIYGAESGQRTFAHLLACCRSLIDAGWHVIVDATFLRHAHRAPFTGLADALGVDWRILSMQAAPDTLRARIAARQAQPEEASEAGLDVLAMQLAGQEDLSEAERARCVVFDADASADWPGLLAQLAPPG